MATLGSIAIGKSISIGNRTFLLVRQESSAGRTWLIQCFVNGQVPTANASGISSVVNSVISGIGSDVSGGLIDIGHGRAFLATNEELESLDYSLRALFNYVGNMWSGTLKNGYHYYLGSDGTLALANTGSTNRPVCPMIILPSSTTVNNDDTITEATGGTPIATKLSKPSLTSASFTYNGSSQSPTLNSNFDSSLMTRSGDLNAVDAGNYSMTISLKDKVNCCWTDGSTTDIELSWKITRANITVTPSQSGTLKYTGREQSPSWSNYDTSKLTISPSDVSGHTGTVSAVNAGTYYVKFTPTDNYQWSGGLTAAKEISWKIDRADLSVPTLSQTDFEYTGQEIDIKPFLNNYDSTKMSISENTGTNAATYTATFVLSDSNYQWVSETGAVSTSNKSISWRITKKSVIIPILDNLEFTYNGEEHFPKINNLDSEFINIAGTGTESKTDAGTYQITFTLKNTANLQWADNTTATKTYTWEIKRKQISKPKISESTLSFEYNGETHTPVLIGFDNTTMTKSETLSASDAGDYTIKVTPTKNYMWEDETTETITLSWAIERMPIPYPYFAPGDEVVFYAGNVNSPPVSKLLNYSTEKMSLVGYNYRYVGDYSISCTPTRNYKWEDGSTGQYAVAWKVRYRESIPTCTPEEFVYDGQEHSPELTYNSANVDCDGIVSAVEVGEYKITFSLKNPNSYAWADRTFDDKSFAWSISAPQYEVIEKLPVQKGVLYYNGNLQSPKWENYDSSKLYMSGIVNGVNAGTYTAEFTPVDGYAWSDGSTDTVSVAWTINKKQIDIPKLVNNSIEYTGERRSPQIDGYISGIMSVNGDKGAVDVGEYTAYVSLADTNNYSWNDDTVEDKPLYWEITHKRIDVLPSQKDVLTYNGELQIPTWDNWDRNEMVLGGVTSGISAGEYKATFTPTYNYCWVDGSRNAVEVSWIIVKTTLKTPKQSGELIYNGEIQYPAWNDNYNSVYMTVNGEISGIDAKTYTVRFVCDPNCVFNNGESSVAVVWEIMPSPTAVPPVIDNEHLVYNGEVQSPLWVMLDMKQVQLSGVLEAKNVGEYIAYAYPAPNYCWKSTLDARAVEYQWEITRKPITNDPWYSGELVFEYNGEEQSPEWINYPQDYVLADGAMSAVDSGDFSVTFSVDGNHCWIDGTFSPYSIEWKIDKKKIRYPHNNDILVYNGSAQSPNWLYYNEEEVEISRDISGIDAGKYTSRFTPRSNYQWENGETYAVNVDWTIDKYHFKYPFQAEDNMPLNPYDIYGNKYLKYNGSEQTPTLWFGNIYNNNIETFNVSLYFEISGDVSAVNAGEYSMILIPDKNHCWEYGDSEPYAVTWIINKRALPLPKKNGEEYYTGELITPSFENYDSTVLEISGEASGIELGDYVVYFEIIDKNNNTWERNNINLTEYDKVAVGWEIVRPFLVAEIPYQKNWLQYNGNKQSPAFANYDPSLMTLIGGIPSKTDIGVYYAVFRLKIQVVWSDGTTEDKKVPWEIEKRRYPKPYVLMPEDGGGMFYYEIEGKCYPIWVYYDPDVMTIGGDSFDTDGTSHITVFELKDPDRTEWDDGTSGAYEVEWRPDIPYVPEVKPNEGNIRVHIPQQIDPEYEDGTAKAPKWDRFDDVAIMVIGGVWSGIDVGTYYVILKLHYGYIWEDGTFDIKIVPWNILAVGESKPENPEMITVHIPVQINIPDYNGQVKTPEWDIWDEFGFDIIGGEIYGILPGTYYIKLKPKPGHIWENGTIEEIIVEWIIVPRKPEDLPDDSVPREPLPEREGEPDNSIPNGGGTCCCCDTGLFDKIINSGFDDGVQKTTNMKQVRLPK